MTTLDSSVSDALHNGASETSPNQNSSHDPSGEHTLEPMSLTARIINLLVILVPLAAFVLAIVMAWGWGVGWTELALFFVMYLITGFGITVGYHRLFTHKSFSAGPVMTWILGAAGSMAVEGSIIEWCADHRRHHKHSDQAGDPHSPHHDHGEGVLGILRGLWHAHMGWILCMTGGRGGTDANRFVPDLLREKNVVTMSRMFPVFVLASLILPAAIGGLVTMSWWGAFLGFIWGGLARVFFVHHVTWSVNSICHIWGTQPFRSHDESRNNAIVGVLALGEGWHNNHHAFPESARHGLRWWEVDTSWMLIWTLSKLGLVRNVRVPSARRLASKAIADD